MTRNRVYRIPPPTPKPTRGRAALNAFQRAHKLDVAQAVARKHQPKPSSWWTQHAQPDADRSAFVAAIDARHTQRLQRLASSAGIAVTRPIAALGGLE